MKVIEMDPSDKNICIVLNDNDQDGTDVSWIYDTFFEKLMKESTKKLFAAAFVPTIWLYVFTMAVSKERS